MKKSILIKAIIISFLSIFLGLSIYFDEMRKGALGKDEYLKRESIRFDYYLLHPHISIIIVTFFCSVILFGVYELLCHFIFKVIDKMKNNSNSF